MKYPTSEELTAVWEGRERTETSALLSDWEVKAEYRTHVDEIASTEWLPLLSETYSGPTENIAVEKLISRLFEVYALPGSGTKTRLVLTLAEIEGFEIQVRTRRPYHHHFEANMRATMKVRRAIDATRRKFDEARAVYSGTLDSDPDKMAHDVDIELLPDDL